MCAYTLAVLRVRFLAVGFFMLSGYQALAATPDKLYFSLIARIPEFMLGAVVALLIRQRELPMALATALGALGASMLVVSLVTIDKRYFPGFWSAVPCVGAALLIAARRGPVNAALATRPMVWFGGCPTRSISGIGRSGVSALLLRALHTPHPLAGCIWGQLVGAGVAFLPFRGDTGKKRYRYVAPSDGVDCSGCCGRPGDVGRATA